MKQIIIAMVVLTIATVIGWFLIISLVANVGSELHNDIKQEYSQHIGDTIIMQNDTSIIVDYSIINNSFTLSNGTIVAKSFIENTKQHGK